MPTRTPRGGAVVDFVLVVVVIVPAFLGILQLAFVPYVRNAVSAARSEGARLGAALGDDPADGDARTRSQISEALAGRYASDVAARKVMVEGAPAVEVTVHFVIPALGPGGPGATLDLSGHAIKEQR